MSRLCRILLALFLALIPVVAIALPAFAVTALPDTLNIDSVYVFRNAKVSGDQYYLMHYTIDYAVLPSDDAGTLTIDESKAGQAFIFRLKTAGAVVFCLSEPYSYHTNGYGEGNVGFYVTPDSAASWGSAVTAEIVGNPGVAWAGGIAPTDTSAMTSWYTEYDPSTVLALRIIAEATLLETDWADTAMVDDTGERLGTSGKAYYLGTVGDLSVTAPDAFPLRPEGLSEPDALDVDYDTGDDTPGALRGARGLAKLVDGTPLDFDSLATALHISVKWVNTLVVLAFCILVDVLVFGRRMQTAGSGGYGGLSGGNTKGIVLVDDFIFIVAAAMGLLPLEVIIGGSLLAGLATFFILFYNKSGA